MSLCNKGVGSSLSFVSLSRKHGGTTESKTCQTDTDCQSGFGFSPRMSACQIISARFSRKQEGKGYVVALASNEVLQKRHQVASSDIAVSAFSSFFADGAAAVAQKEVARTNTLLMGMSATSTTTLHPTPVSGTQSIIKQMREPLFPIAPTFWTCTLIQSMLSGPVLCFSGT